MSPTLSDMRNIQTKLQYRKTRVGLRRELQKTCPERIYRNTQWIDALEHITFCNGHEKSESSSLRKSAVVQCGAWCVGTRVTNDLPYG